MNDPIVIVAPIELRFVGHHEGHVIVTSPEIANLFEVSLTVWRALGGWLPGEAPPPASVGAVNIYLSECDDSYAIVYPSGREQRGVHRSELENNGWPIPFGDQDFPIGTQLHLTKARVAIYAGDKQWVVHAPHKAPRFRRPGWVLARLS